MKRLLSLLLALTMATGLVTAASAETVYYEGSAQGFGSQVKSSVSLEGGKIVALEVDDSGETYPLAKISRADTVEKYIAAVLEAGTCEGVDTTTGATFTCNAIEEVLKKALAGGDEGDPAAEPAAEAYTSDVLVIGGGVAGLTSAVSAAEAGASVILIDKMPALGGTTAVAGGILVCVGSELFKDSRLASDNVDTVVEYWKKRMAVSGVDSGYPDWDRLTGVIAETGATVDWLVANNVTFAPTPFAASDAYPMALADGGGAGLVSMLQARAEALGVTIYTGTKATELLTDETGAVIGAKAEGENRELTFSADAVVLATGGISQNPELVEKYSPKLIKAGLIPPSSASNTGDGLLMAEAVGAYVFPEFSTALWNAIFDPAFTAVADTSILNIANQLGVDASGKRIGNEAAAAGWDSTDYIASQMIQDANGPYWYIFDSSDKAQTAELEKGVAAGCVLKANTIHELGVAFGVTGKTFDDTYNKYKMGYSFGGDSEFRKPKANMKKLDTKPFYAVKVFPTTFGSVGGVATTEEGRVTREDGTVIPGLYAAGEMSNRYFYNENYILAASLAMYSTMGHRTGAAAAADALAK